MTLVVIPVSQVSTASRVQVSVHVQAEVMSPEAARRQANVWLLENVGNLLRAETPELVMGERLAWRMNVVLTSPVRGTLGRVGQLELDATTGEVVSAGAALIKELRANAQALANN
jgi:hypothetical protein